MIFDLHCYYSVTRLTFKMASVHYFCSILLQIVLNEVPTSVISVISFAMRVITIVCFLHIMSQLELISKVMHSFNSIPTTVRNIFALILVLAFDFLVFDVFFSPDFLQNSFGRPDVVAAETLANHVRCNNSFVHAVFQAQFCSSVTCPRCDRQSNTFDPFLCVSVPVPQNHHGIYVTVLYASQQPRQVCFRIFHRGAGIFELHNVRLFYCFQHVFDKKARYFGRKNDNTSFDILGEDRESFFTTHF